MRCNQCGADMKSVGKEWSHEHAPSVYWCPCCGSVGGKGRDACMTGCHFAAKAWFESPVALEDGELVLEDAVT